MSWPKGVPRPASVREKIAAALRGQPKSDDSRRSMSIAATGRRHTDATRAKISEARRRAVEKAASSG